MVFPLTNVPWLMVVVPAVRFKGPIYVQIPPIQTNPVDGANPEQDIAVGFGTGAAGLRTGSTCIANAFEGVTFELKRV